MGKSTSAGKPILVVIISRTGGCAVSLAKALKPMARQINEVRARPPHLEKAGGMFIWLLFGTKDIMGTDKARCKEAH
jgi:hypothetical protein